MSTSTALAITNSAVSNLQGYFSATLPLLIPIIIAVMVLFGGIWVLKVLWHRRV